MKVQSLNNYQSNFKANYFTIEKRGRYFNLSKISTDNAEKLGKEPMLQTKIENIDCEFPMVYDGKYYTTELPSYIDKYKIFYKDTGKYEKSGREQNINPTLLKKIAITEDRKFNKLPLEESFAKGEASGKVFVNTFDIPKNIPAILILDEVDKEETLILDIPHNVKGIITSSCDFGVLSHVANLTRNRISAMSIIWDGEKYDSLKNLGGKYISINNEKGLLEYKEIKPNSKEIKSETVEKIEVPKLDKVEKLLNFDELTTQNCGTKGYRLGVMQKLAKEGKLKDIIIPNGFVIPEGYINKFREYINIENEEKLKKRISEGIYTEDTENKIKELNLPRRYLIIRSNFNTEDLGSFSSAGIYHSNRASTFGNIMLDVDEIINCSTDKNYNPIAKKTHKKYGIQNKDIQPSVIVQEYIKAPDYRFTLYTDNGENNLIIDLSDANLGYLDPGNSLIKYNKKTKELTPERKLSPIAEYILDKRGKITDQNHQLSSIDKNWNALSSLLGIVTTGALILEKFFKKPQDIEGGIKDGKVYFWQTRDIVAKAVKRI